MQTPGDMSEPQPGQAGEADEPSPEPPSRLTLEAVLEAPDYWPPERDLAAMLDRVARVLAADPAIAAALGEAAAACVAFSSDEHVAELNGRFRGKPTPTNVLSFPAPPPPADVGLDGEPRALGDIVLAAGVVAREADAEGKPYAHHLQHLVVHGVLHLLGHDHEDDAEAEAMERLETALLAKLGVPDPYSERE